MSILVINAGSSSIKYTLFERESLQIRSHGLIEELHDHHAGFETMQQRLMDDGFDIRTLDAIGHRVVHGGERFLKPTRIDAALIDELKKLIPLAPLHNPANIEGIVAARALAPGIANIAVFDTAFHHSMPEYAYRYPLPHELYFRDHVRRYGFHGTSHYYVATQAAIALERPLESLNLITLHIGNGVSACAIQNGKSVDTTMGMTPLEGLMMGTRCGSIDPGIILYLMREGGLSVHEIDTLFNKRSGLKAIGGESDMRQLMEASENNDANAALAIEMFTYRLKKQIGAYSAVLGNVDAVVFTGGIGEHAALIRTLACQGLERFGLAIDELKNSAGEMFINTLNSPTKILVIPTDEERQIALHVKELLHQ